MISHSGGNSLDQACNALGDPESGLASEIARLSDNLAQSEMQIAALNCVLDMMRTAAGGRRAQSADGESQALRA